MVTTSTDTKLNAGSNAGRAAFDIHDELAELRADIAALAKSVGKYGRSRADDMQHRAHDLPDELLDDTRLALKRMRQQISGLERNLEGNVREHPLQWFMGAAGLGLLIAFFIRWSR